MALSNVSICNQALTMLSTERITSLTDGSENAAKCNILYNDTRDTLLAEHKWNFARTQASLSLLDETPILTSEWYYIYQLPAEPYCLKVLRMEGDDDFAVFGRKLYAKVDTANIEYIARVEDESQMTYAFAKAFATRLALELSYGVTESNTVVENMIKFYNQALNEAKWADAQEGKSLEIVSGTFIASRKK